MHNDKRIGLTPITPEQILKDDLARASRAKTEQKNMSKNQILANEVMLPSKHTNLVPHFPMKFV